jgi:hydrogenase maturation protein HypF
MSLLTKTIDALSSAGFQVLTHHQIPPNDGGISLGQAAVGLKTLSVED